MNFKERIPTTNTEGSFWESKLILRARSRQAEEVRVNYSRRHFTWCLPRPPPLGTSHSKSELADISEH